MTINQVIIATTIGLTSMVHGQSAKEYFLPDSTHNKVTFYTPSKSGGRTSMTRAIFYIKKGATYEVMDARMFNGKASSIQTMTLKFSTNEIKMAKSVSTTMMETNKERDYNPPTVIFKMPPLGKTISWMYTTITGDELKCTSSWTTVNVDGVDKKAIKLVQQYVGLSSKSIEYYVKGIGIYRTDLEGDGTTQTSDKFDGLSYEQTE